MTYELDNNTDPVTAEQEAIATEAAEQTAEARFDAVHAALEAQGRVSEATDSPEFREWMAARSHTDAAWGRWAMAMDAQRSVNS